MKLRIGRLEIVDPSPNTFWEIIDRLSQTPVPSDCHEAGEIVVMVGQALRQSGAAHDDTPPMFYDNCIHSLAAQRDVAKACSSEHLRDLLEALSAYREERVGVVGGLEGRVLAAFDKVVSEQQRTEPTQ